MRCLSPRMGASEFSLGREPQEESPKLHEPRDAAPTRGDASGWGGVSGLETWGLQFLGLTPQAKL